jgi:hypothetical protein
LNFKKDTGKITKEMVKEDILKKTEIIINLMNLMMMNVINLSNIFSEQLWRNIFL